MKRIHMGRSIMREKLYLYLRKTDTYEKTSFYLYIDAPRPMHTGIWTN